MRIGMLAGDVWEAERYRPGITSSHYVIEGYLAKRLVERGHEVVLLTRVPNGTDTDPKLVEGGDTPFDYLGHGFEYMPDARPHELGLDLIWCDRLKRASDMYERAMYQLEVFEGPVVYNQMLTYPGWAPPFGERDWLARKGNKTWLVLNRATDAELMYRACASRNEIPTKKQDVHFATWYPFLQLEALFDGKLSDVQEKRDFTQGYVGRFPRAEDRTKRVVHFLNHDRWDRIIFGRTLEWVCDKTGTVNGGAAEQGRLRQALERFSMTVGCQFDRNPKGCGFWPNRIVECAMAGVLQLFDTSWGLDEFDYWTVRDQADMIHWMDNCDSLAREVAEQRKIIMPRCDPERVLDAAEERMREACSL